MFSLDLTITFLHTEDPTSLFVPLEEVPLVFDQYLFSLNPKGVDVVDVNDNHVLEIYNKKEVDKVLCYNKHSKCVASIKKDQLNVFVLSSIHYNDK